MTGSVATELRRTPLVPPRPQPVTKELPLWRLILLLRRNALQTWGEPAFELDVASRPFLGRQSILLNEPSGIRRVLVDNHANYGRTPATIRILHPMLGDGLFLADGAKWRHQRRTVAPAFAPRSLDLVARHVVDVAGETVRRLAAESSTVDLLGTAQRLALEVAGRALFSTTMTRHGGSVRAAMESYGRRSARPTIFDFLLPANVPSPFDPIRRWAGADFKAVLGQIIAERAKQGVGEPPRDLYDLLVTARDPETGEGFGPDLLRDQIATLLIAGHETTALSLFWSFYLLALDPGWQEAIAVEVDALDVPLEKAAERLPTARAVVSEALRLYPPAFTIVRMARAADEVAGREVPKGAFVVIAPWVLHRHKKRWANPHAFDPTRFLPGAPPPDRYAYLPFGVGPRVCIGAQFALTEATLVLARLCHAFRISISGSPRVVPVAVVTTVPDRRPGFRLEARIAGPAAKAA
jgi:cytochrome P450